MYLFHYNQAISKKVLCNFLKNLKVNITIIFFKNFGCKFMVTHLKGRIWQLFGKVCHFIIVLIPLHSNPYYVFLKLELLFSRDSLKGGRVLVGEGLMPASIIRHTSRWRPDIGGWGGGLCTRELAWENTRVDVITRWFRGKRGVKRGVHVNHAQYLHNEGIEEWAFEGASATSKVTVS